MRKLLPFLVLIALLLLVMLNKTPGSQSNSGPFSTIIPPDTLNVPYLPASTDRDGDGLDDRSDIVAGARAEVARQPRYRSAYYSGGYPPAEEGVCTDVIWRAYRDAGYDLKTMVDEDIRRHPDQYPRVDGSPDPNIDFRRVANLQVFLENEATVLTTELIPGDLANLTEWQGGDIVTFGLPYEHIAVVSDQRRPDGVPYIIHNSGPTPRESDDLLDWPSPITGHYRFPD